MAGPGDNSGEERTETATAFRREEFRKQGTVAMSRELLSSIIFLAAGLGLYFIGPTFKQQFGLMGEQFFSFKYGLDITKAELLVLRVDLLRYWAWMAVPLLMILLVAGVVGSVAQVGFYVSWEPMTPNWDRINPVSGFQRLFSMKGAVEAVKALIKLSIVCIVIYLFVRKETGGAGSLLAMPIGQSLGLTISSMGKLFSMLVFSLLALSILDYGFQRYQLEQQMKMTRSEAKEEFKLREGDPLIKSRIRGIQRRMANRRMMEDVPEADVVVTNPTHLAVALKYDAESMSAPKVVAKGAGVIAQKIKEIARFHQIPCVENKPLARTLFKNLDINDYIPRELYKAVAEVLAYVYRLKGRLTHG